MIKYQVNSSCVIMSVISMTTLFALILQGEIWCWSVLGLKGLKNGIQCFGSSKQRSSAFWLFKHWNSVFCLSNKFFFNMGSFILWLFQTLEFSVFAFPNLGILDFGFSRHWNSVFCLSQTFEFKNFAFPNIGFQCFALSKHINSGFWRFQHWNSLFWLFQTLEFYILAFPNIAIQCFWSYEH